MNTKALILACLAAGLLTAVPLCAAAGRHKPMFGIEGSFAMPVGNTHKAASTGFGVSLFLEGVPENRVTKKGKTFRDAIGFSINYASLSEKKWERSLNPGSENATSIDCIDLQFYGKQAIFHSEESGLYYIFGMGCGYATIDNSTGANSRSFVAIGAVGLEYCFNRNVGLIAKYTNTGLRGNSLDKNLLRGRNLEYLQFGARYRF
jgi:hypothetical protein